MWRLTIGINHYWLSNEEKEYYLKSIDGGADKVVLESGLILSKNFLDIAPKNMVEDSNVLDKGGWYCSSRVLHESGEQCYCKMRINE